jgi:hypothetical protein
VQNKWLGPGSATSAGWHRYLENVALEEQLALGAKADKNVVAAILKKYDSGAAGLERPQFVAVRTALAAWLAELSQPTPAELPQVALAAKETYTPPPADHVAQTRARLNQALNRLNNYLAPSAANRAAWQEYLGWSALRAELAKEVPEINVLEAVGAKFYQNEVGLDLPPFVGAREALRDYTTAVKLAAVADGQAAYHAQLDALSQQLTEFHAAPTDKQSVAIGQMLGELHRAEQARPLISAVRRNYAQPNLFVVASQRLAASGVDDAVDDITPVREVILGTNIIGTAHTLGQVSLRTIPDGQRALLEILMTGTSRSNNRGYNGPVTIYSTGTTSLSASKRIFVDAHGIHAQPAVAVASTDTNIHGIGAKHKIVRKIAAKRIAQSSGQAEAIASKRAERRLEKRVDERAGEMLAKASDAFENKFRRPLLRKDAFPQLLNFATSMDHVYVTALQAGPNRLGAPSAPPALEGDFDLSVRIHETIAGNAAEVILAGRLLTDERLAELLMEATGDIPEELQISEDKDPWSITFAEVRPFSVEFTGQTATLAIRGRQFTRGDQQINDNMLISAKYQIEQDGSGSKLTRDGDVLVEYVDIVGRQSIRQITFKTFLRKKFESLFKEEYASDGLRLPGEWRKAGRLTLRQLQVDQGWLTLGWELPESGQRVASVAAE